jgi:hypothetical protein
MGSTGSTGSTGVIESGEIRVKVICGEVNGVHGPARGVVVDPEYLDVTVPAETTFTHPIRRGYTAFAHVIEGEGYFDPERNAYAHEVVWHSMSSRAGHSSNTNSPSSFNWIRMCWGRGTDEVAALVATGVTRACRHPARHSASCFRAPQIGFRPKRHGSRT